MLDASAVDVAAVADALTETDALTANDGETLHPDRYVVEAENLPYLVGTVLALSVDAPRIPDRPELDALLVALAAFKDGVESFLNDAEQGASSWGTCSGEWARLESLRALVDAAPSTSPIALLVQSRAGASSDH